MGRRSGRRLDHLAATAETRIRRSHGVEVTPVMPVFEDTCACSRRMEARKSQ